MPLSHTTNIARTCGAKLQWVVIHKNPSKESMVNFDLWMVAMENHDLQGVSRAQATKEMNDQILSQQTRTPYHFIPINKVER